MKKSTLQIIAFLLLFSVVRSKGQTIYSSSTPDTLLKNFSGLTHLSSDIIATPLIGGTGGYLWAVSYGTNTNMGLIVNHSNGATVTTAGTNAKADIALGDVVSSLGSRYYVAVASTSAVGSVRGAFLTRFQVRNVGTGTMFLDGKEEILCLMVSVRTLKLTFLLIQLQGSIPKLLHSTNSLQHGEKMMIRFNSYWENWLV